MSLLLPAEVKRRRVIPVLSSLPTSGWEAEGAGIQSFSTKYTKDTQRKTPLFLITDIDIKRAELHYAMCKVYKGQKETPDLTLKRLSFPYYFSKPSKPGYIQPSSISFKIIFDRLLIQFINNCGLK